MLIPMWSRICVMRCMRRSRSWVVVAGIAVALVASACGPRAGRPLDSETTSAVSSTPQQHVEGTTSDATPKNPIPGGVVLEQPRSSALPFLPEPLPEALGDPTAIMMTPPDIVPLAHREIAFGFEDSPFGAFVLSESLAIPAAGREFRDLAGEHPGCTTGTPDAEGTPVDCVIGNRELIPLAGGRVGLLLSGSSGVTVLVVRPANGVAPIAAKEFPEPVVLIEVDARGMSHDDGLALAHVLGDPA